MKKILSVVFTIAIVVLASKIFAQEAGKMASGSAPDAKVVAPQVMNQVADPTIESPSENMQENAAMEEKNEMMNETEPAEGEGVTAPENAPTSDDMMMKHDSGSMEHMGPEGK